MAQPCTNQQLELLPAQFEGLQLFSSSSIQSIHHQLGGIENQVADSKPPFRKKENKIRFPR
jgi:hypothetical protein